MCISEALGLFTELLCFQMPPVISSLWSPEKDIISKRKIAIIRKQREKAVSLLRMNKSGLIQINNRIQPAVLPWKEQLQLRLNYEGKDLLTKRCPNSGFWFPYGWGYTRQIDSETEDCIPCVLKVLLFIQLRRGKLQLNLNFALCAYLQ